MASNIPKFTAPKTMANVGLTSCLIKLMPVLCLGLIVLPLVFQNSESVQSFLRSKFDSFAATEGDGAGVTVGPRIADTIAASTKEEEEEKEPTVISGPVQQLIEEIREATIRAAGGLDISFSDAHREAWELKNPCRSRRELKPLYDRRRHMRDVPVNRQWELVVQEYEKLHYTCMTRVGNLAEYFKSQNSSVDCNFVIAESHFGLGNKMYHLASVFMYAILSQRVMLIPESTSVPSVVCEPFAGSSWKINEAFHNIVKKKNTESIKFYNGVDKEMNHSEILNIFAADMDNVWGPEPRFYCNTEQRYLSTVRWITIDGCLLFLHKLYAVEKYRPTLEALFPQRIVLTYILRSVLLPADPVWERVLHVNEVYLQDADKQIGIQVRFLKGEKEYNERNSLINDRISRCVWENKILPEVCPESPKDPGYGDPKFAECSVPMTPDDHEHPHIIKVLVGSLFLGLHDYLNDIYLRHEKTTTKEAVGIIQLTHELIQGNGVEVDSQALVEIISLSLSDVLIVTPMSTFGGVAQSYGGLIPWFIDFASKKGEPDKCQRGMGIEPCYLGANNNYDCPYDPPGTQKIPTFVPYLRDCLFIDVGAGYGMQMVPEKFEDHDFGV